MALVWAILNYSKKILSIIIRELKQFFRLVKEYQKTSRQDKKKLLMKILILEALKYAIAIGCSYLGISEGLIPILKLLIEILLGG
ncbi:hypothetical protein Metvu_0560 [Methanocaldococcus vulcanius M7]|uniref:Uncharacterized protein n=1 Tax=Methanocaldococcus vulcanius (strain ATCC 700851 / DSM 12094 / M7) TaxID=579137 RepID=C9RFR7_METVM|nr:hypothetical protein Metvu_0560 [Methanocaldococcus vulcanius M7]